jgi:hypothetical protein
LEASQGKEKAEPMKKYIVLSVNDNVDYLYFTPLTCWAWRYFGWEPIVFYKSEEYKIGSEADQRQYKLKQLAINQFLPANNVFDLTSIEPYRADTITQVSRLYGSCIESIGMADYIMTGDIDMIPLSNYWTPNENRVTVYGHDLTGFSHFPICYIGMPKIDWQMVMYIEYNNSNYDHYIKRDLDTLPQAKDPDFYKYWFSDQDLITDRLKQYGTGKIDFINRGQGAHGYARGRVDRANGGWVFDQPELIDAHLMQQTWQNDEKVQKLYELLAHVWPNEDFTWFKKYTEEFKKLAV